MEVPRALPVGLHNRRVDGLNAAVRSSILKGKTQRLVT